MEKSVSASVFIGTIFPSPEKKSWSGDQNTAANFEGEQEEKEVLGLGGGGGTKKGSGCRKAKAENELEINYKLCLRLDFVSGKSIWMLK